MDTEEFQRAIFHLDNEKEFNRLALWLFRFQYANLPVYQQYCQYLGLSPNQVNAIEKIPFLPVDFFRTQRVCSLTHPADLVFSSSGTSGNQTSYHEVPDPSVYEKSFTAGFTRFYGAIEQYTILALLPSYLERSGSSLVYMADRLIRLSQKADSGFYLNELEKLSGTLQRLKEQKSPVLLLGVTYALLDLAEQYPLDFPELIVMETGGMKGRRKEMIREEVHQQLRQAFGVTHIHSEYGMTELLSQAYSKGDGQFETPPWMKVLIRDTNDPLSLLPAGRSGGINVIDLANIYSCAFIAVQDIGLQHLNGKFEVLGRFDDSQVRGCNLLVY